MTLIILSLLFDTRRACFRLRTLGYSCLSNLLQRLELILELARFLRFLPLLKLILEFSQLLSLLRHLCLHLRHTCLLSLVVRRGRQGRRTGRARSGRWRVFCRVGPALSLGRCLRRRLYSLLGLCFRLGPGPRSWLRRVRGTSTGMTGLSL